MARLSNGLPTGHGWPDGAYFCLAVMYAVFMLLIMSILYVFSCNVLLGIIYLGIVILIGVFISNTFKELDRADELEQKAKFEEELRLEKQKRLDAIERNRKLHGDYW